MLGCCFLKLLHIQKAIPSAGRSRLQLVESEVLISCSDRGKGVKPADSLNTPKGARFVFASQDYKGTIPDRFDYVAFFPTPLVRVCHYSICSLALNL